MIFCNTCGNALDSRALCSECGTQTAHVTKVEPPPTQRFLAATAAAAAPALDPTYQQTIPAHEQAALGNLPVATQLVPQSKPSIPKGLIVVLAGVGVLLIALLAYLAAHSSSPTTPTSARGASGSSVDDLAAALNRAIDGGSLVNLTGDDAYSHFARLTAMDPRHQALSNAKSKVLPQLRSIGEGVINRKVNHSGEVSEQDWMTLVRAYEWAHLLEPSDRALEARQKYAQAKLAEAQGRRNEAWQNFSAAAQLDPSWAVPQNDLGYWTTQDSSSGKQKWSNAIPYYERAISLQADWEIPYNNLGTAYFYLDNLDTAEGYYRQAIQRNSHWARPHKWLGDIYERKNDFATAVREYQTAVDLYNPNNDSLRIDLIQKEIARLHTRGY
jgi:tetratricopeptide (TPR) repeat protein